MNNFWETNKVLILGGLMAVLVAVQDIIVKTGTYSGKVLGFAVAIALLSFLANKLRGQWASIATIVVGSLTTISQDTSGKPINWAQVLVPFGIALIGVFLPPAKSVGYEQTAIIQSAKAQGEQITGGTVAPPNPPV
jgi:hypothetical protein